ncbi:efflux RND transporter periplasmic adaptor subunit [Microbulbifer spongiae]|uniref:HlyD family efflux transporter periplasmic adaptor subunit n=1 Tax=Microbulbifer spongiae TaxID=2944933 RepID=A0ABY9E816_9GAMM|nr:HlyD family efflux transporter periplasmic adaptor subunit [Microbulbifer sp. MI-G]WKD49194.1 HlyD family efflux transporter periplasmic adaptor subunit [Microbulbifer sp. MI-G]
MDIKLTSPKKKTFQKKYLLYVIALMGMLYAVRYLWLFSQTGLSIDKNELVFGEVKRGDFSISVRGTGILVPENIQWLSASVEAEIKKRYVKPGDSVKKGDLLVELSNQQLSQQLEEAEWQLEAEKANYMAEVVRLDTSILQQEAAVLDAELAYDQGRIEYKAFSDLIEQGIVPKLDYVRSEIAMNQAKRRWEFSVSRLEKIKDNVQAQKNANEARLKQFIKRFERIQQQVTDLKVVATIDSIVLDIPLEPGQRVRLGDNIAKLAEKDTLIAELQVPEIQVRDIEVGKPVIIDTRNSKVKGVVSRVEPTVNNGNVQVDVTFSEPLPSDARPDLSVDGEIFIAKIPDTLYVKRPLFSQSKSSTTLYKLTGDGQFAERIDVRLGLGSVNQIQIILGLEAGDKIVTSDPSRFDSYQKFRVR